MVLGMSLHAFTVLHVFISVLELISGALVLLRLMAGALSRLSGLFLLTAALTAITGFLFPFHGVTPGIILGVLSLVATAVAAIALYGSHVQGGWRRTFAIASVILLYFDAFVALAQSFEKIAPLHALAPTQKEPPFAIAQGVLLLIFLVAGVRAARAFRALPAVA